MTIEEQVDYGQVNAALSEFILEEDRGWTKETIANFWEAQAGRGYKHVHAVYRAVHLYVDGFKIVKENPPRSHKEEIILPAR